ncbi:putative LIPOPROTEIN SIGNAL PEPTIDE [Bradyrhizobium sp. STM 3843]|uniref:alpha/beta hydrolase family protein n=1 Tax=Bradyrhizobium sp. STM 3843 TaxID=551947 RepID=UPI000240B061|nr:alpha/beta fold hydrolase [Bradyrhizobium sp. STM 3843]CCE07030.1 putative LIPOPROTEIN SIGNAL PEPTIDE [Bradyrhizobium sp. STM 3843]
MPIGFAHGRFDDPARPNWDGDAARPVTWAAWYPAAAGAVEAQLPIAPLPQGWFKADTAALNAPLNEGRYPLVVFSHGTGGHGLQQEWLARDLARRGFIAVTVDHHGNSHAEPYRAEGFLCSWERARDITLLLDRIETIPAFAGRIDPDRIFAVGYSLGGATVTALLGAIMVRSPFEPGANLGRGPREFPDLADHLPRLLEQSRIFRESWARMSDSYRDIRIKAALLLAPGRSVQGFSEASIAAIEVPARIMVGGGDFLAPTARWLHERLPNSRLDIVAPEAGHYVFLPESTEMGRSIDPTCCLDPPSVDRGAIHREASTAAAELFSTANTLPVDASL